MNRRSIALLFALLLIAASVYWFRDRTTQPPQPSLPGLFASAPSDATTLLYVDLAALRHSPFVVGLLSLVPAPREDPEYRAFVEATGFDYSRDLDRIIVALRPSRTNASTATVAEGRFNREKIVAYAMRSGRLEKQQRFDVYVVPTGEPSRAVSFTFTAPNRIVLTNSSVLTAGFGSQSGGTLPPDLRDPLLRVAGGAIIAVTKIDPDQKNFSFFGTRSREFSKVLHNFRTITLAARPDANTLKVALEGECASPAAARELGQQVEALRLLGRVLLADPQTRRQLSPQLLTLADLMVRSGEFLITDNRLQLRFEMTPATLGSPAAKE